MGFLKILISISFIGTLFLTLFLGAFIYLRERREQLKLVFAGFSIVVAIWAMGQLFFILNASSYSMAYFWIKFCHVGVVFIPSTFLHIVYTFIERKIRFRKRIVFVYVVSFSFALSLLTKLLIAGLYETSYFSYFPKPGFLYPYFFIFFVSVVSYGTIMLYGGYCASKGYKRLQLKYLFLGSAFGFLCTSIHFLPFVNLNTYPYTLIGSYGVPFAYLLISYALSRYRVIDLSIVLAKLFVYVISYGTILVSPLIISFLFKRRLLEFFNDDWWFVPFGLFVLLGSIAPYLSLVITRRAENKMLKKQRQYHHTLKAASSGMTRIRDLDKLLKLTVRVIARSVKVKHVAIFLLDKDMEGYRLMESRGGDRIPQGHIISGDEPIVHYLYYKRTAVLYEDLSVNLRERTKQKEESDAFYSLLSDVEFQLKELKVELVVPSFVGETLFGFLTLGSKMSGDIYTREDMRIFSSLANQAALSIENALSYRELQFAQAQLFQSEKMATMGQLAGGMAHEIHNPLTIVSGQAQIFLERLKNKTTRFLTEEELIKERERMKNALQTTINEVQRASVITRRIIQHSKPTEKGKSLIDLNFLIDDTLIAVGHQVKLNNMVITKKYHPHLPYVFGSYHQIQEVLLNLILNAVQIMKGKGSIDITTNTIGRYVEVLVADSGPGIPRERLSRLFDPFYTTRTEGTGLGLFISQRIIQDHAGFINVESVVDQGTTFAVKLPLHRRD